VSNPGRLRRPTSLGIILKEGDAIHHDVTAPAAFHIDPQWAERLKNDDPQLSAATPLVRWQRALFVTLTLAVVGGLLVSTDVTVTAVMALLTPIFLCVALLRVAALWQMWNAALAAPTPVSQTPDTPIYSILVPLYREAHMARALVAALDRLDWPVAQRDIIFITEADDSATRLALEDATMGHSGMRILTVPPGSPRTKPRALMYALPLATGAFVVVYDAEDEPEPDQLRKAFRKFSEAEPDLGCLQAHLNIYNARHSWLTRQFTLEYTALFDAILPAVQRLGLPVPLGGTSNHFRR
jgi:cellulose synthase/poly-beta-1,6-N-acetylglucosamine synthase-like glycosyltransferase